MRHWSRREFLAATAALAAAQAATSKRVAAVRQSAYPIAPGPFAPDWESLKQYKCPEWFRDAKFGIWAHWSPQCVPEDGDWYARNMYIEGSGQYKYHLAHYGHPSKFGYKDICHLWHAERWDPERLVDTYRRAGAKYFVALANHHGNFDNWNSKHHRWNAVAIGPKKDLIGGWERAARRNGLRFGVTVHCARSWDWFQVSHGADKTGPLAGVPYDGHLTAADGKGQWWDGYDPQELYCRVHPQNEPPDQSYVDQFFYRVQDLLDQHHPDLLYFDDARLPLGAAGLSIAAHMYNASIQRNGKLDAVLTTKIMPDDLLGTLVLDIERGRSGHIEEYPWQTDTCIGDWHYSRPLYEANGYKTAAVVVPMLVDIVSKNGNLLLNIPVRGDGSIDEREEAFLRDLTRWMDVNHEAIYATRPWAVYGEGPSQLKGGSFNEGRQKPYSARDIRFTINKRGDTLYATALGWPADGALRVRSLVAAAGGQGKVHEVALLGHAAPVRWSQDDNGLVVQMPEDKPGDYAWVLKIHGAGLRDFKPPVVDEETAPIVVSAGAGGAITLSAEQAELHGESIQTEERGGRENIGYWDSPVAWAEWRIKDLPAGSYVVSAEVAAGGGRSTFTVELGGKALTATVPGAASWDDFRTVELGRLEGVPAGAQTLAVRPAKSGWKPINLRAITLRPAGA